jgi:hypothetical protein
MLKYCRDRAAFKKSYKKHTETRTTIPAFATKHFEKAKPFSKKRY